MKSFCVIWDQLTLIPGKIKGINPTSLSLPWTESYFNNYKLPPKLDKNLPEYDVTCDDDK